MHLPHGYPDWCVLLLLSCSACGGKTAERAEQGDASTAASGGAKTGAGGASGSGGAIGSSGGATVIPVGPVNDPCTKPPDPGPCEAAIQRFYFDAASGQCLPFTYGGCQGNDNNFETNAACETVCIRHVGCTCSGCTLECTPCPPDLQTATGTSCTDTAVECFDSSGTFCSCNVGVDGSRTWGCGARAL